MPRERKGGEGGSETLYFFRSRVNCETLAIKQCFGTSPYLTLGDGVGARIFVEIRWFSQRDDQLLPTEFSG